MSEIADPLLVEDDRAPRLEPVGQGFMQAPDPVVGWS